MRTGGSKRGLVFISLAFALVFSIIFVATPVLAGDVLKWPQQIENEIDGTEEIEVVQGQEFLVSWRLVWDEEDKGYYALSIDWLCPENRPEENFTFLSASAYFDNLDPIDATVDFYEGPWDNGTKYTIVVGNATGDPRNGEFMVDVRFRAAGVGGVAHLPTNNHPMHLGTVEMYEDTTVSRSPPNPYITVRVLGRGVEVAISPSENSGPPGETLTYTVTVTNTGDVADNYDLTIGDNAGWVDNITLLENLLEVPPGENETTTLTVTVPEDAVPCTEDNVTVTATSVDDAVSDSASCIAHAKFVPKCGVDITVEPKHQRGTPGTSLTFLVRVHNTGNIEDNYLLSVVPDGWPMENIYFESGFSTMLLENVQPCVTENVFLYVHIPDNAMPCIHKEIVVVAESEFCGATDNDNALIQVVSAYLHAEEPIDLTSPVCTQWHELYPNFSKRYHLTSWKDTNGDGKLSPSDQIEMENETGELDNYYIKDVTVTILISKKPENIENMYLEFEGGFESMENAITWPVGTQWHEIYPNFCKRYHLKSWEDNNHDDVLSPSDQIKMMNKENEDDVYWYRVDEVATDIVICKKPPIAYEVEVAVEPGFNESPPCTWLEYDVTVTNTGTIDDNYDLSVSDNAGWGDDIQLDNYMLTVPVGENRTTTLRVHIPDNAIPSTEDEVTVTATSQGDTSVSDYDTCIAHATVVKGVKLSISPPYQEDLQGETLSYVVTVFNTGNVEDNYTLENTDDEEWTLTLDNILLTVPPWENRTTTLAVIIPGDAIPCTEDTITVTATSQENAEVSAENSCIAHVKVLRKVKISISPGNQSGPPGELTYEVTVANQGNVEDTYDLAASDMDAPSWNPTISTPLTVAAWGSDIATLSVTIPSNAPLGAEHAIEVTATSQADSAVGDSGSCTAKVTALWKVEVSISPDNRIGKPEENLTYSVMVKNEGNILDNYSLAVSDNAVPSWEPMLSENLLTDIGPGENGIVTLTVTIPEDAENGIEDNITVTATSQGDSNVSESASCTATAIAARGVEVSISPDNKSDAPGKKLTFEVTVTNKGDIKDNYTLAVSDDEDWILRLTKSSLEVPPGENKTTTLSVTIPGNAAHCTRDNVTVTATSQRDNTVKDNASCIAHAVIIRKVEVSIVPSHKSDEPGEKLEYTVTVTNTGNVEDRYNLTTSDEAVPSWNPTVSPIFLVIDAGESDTAKLNVTIPSGAGHGEKNDIQVTATSQENAEVSASASCDAEVSIRVRIEVSISPGSGNGESGTSLIYTVTVRNAGLVDDTYTLRAVGAQGWSVSIEPDSLFLAVGDTGEATLTVVVPPDASVGDSMTTQVSVKSGEDPAVIGTDTCRTIVTGVEEGPELELPIPLAISVVLVGAAIIVPAYLLHGRRKKTARRSVLRDVGFGVR